MINIKEEIINNVTYDSRKVIENGLFVCIPGANVDGHDFIDQVIDKVESKDLVLITEIEKLATVAENAEPNFIKAVEASQLKVEDGLLSIVSIGLNQVTDLEDLLNTKADKNTVEEIDEKVDEFIRIMEKVL